MTDCSFFHISPQLFKLIQKMRVSKGKTSNFVFIFQNLWIGYIWYLFWYRGETTQSKRSSPLDAFHCCQAPCPRRICLCRLKGLVSVNLEVYPRCYEYLADMACQGWCWCVTSQQDSTRMSTSSNLSCDAVNIVFLVNLTCINNQRSLSASRSLCQFQHRPHFQPTQRRPGLESAFDPRVLKC